MPEPSDNLLDQLWRDIEPGYAPVDDLIARGRRAGRTRRRKVLAATLAGGLCVVGGAVVGIQLTSSPEATVEPSPTQSGQPSHGEGLSPEDAVSRVVASIDDPMIAGASVIKNPDDPTDPSPWIEVRINSSAGDDIEPVWLGELVVGAAGELMRTSQPNLRQVIAGGQMVDTDTNGDPVTVPIGMGEATAGLTFNSPGATQLEERVSEVASELGIQVASVRVLTPLDSALAVTVKVPPGPVSWSVNELIADLQGSPADVEGVYVEIQSEAGDPLVRASAAKRLGGGGLWFAHGQAERFGANHG